MPYQSKSDEYQAWKAFGILHAQRMKRSGAGRWSITVTGYKAPGRPVEKGEGSVRFVDYDNPIIQAICGLSPVRKWYALEFDDGRVETFNSVQGRVRRVAELTANDMFSTICGYCTIEFERKFT
jgi:hypothetical protein